LTENAEKKKGGTALLNPKTASGKKKRLVRNGNLDERRLRVEALGFAGGVYQMPKGKATSRQPFG